MDDADTGDEAALVAVLGAALGTGGAFAWTTGLPAFAAFDASVDAFALEAALAGAAARTAGLAAAFFATAPWAAALGADLTANGWATAVADERLRAFADDWTVVGSLTAAALGTGLAALPTGSAFAFFFSWRSRPLTTFAAAWVVFAVRVAGAFTRSLLSVPDKACSGGRSLRSARADEASDVADNTGDFGVIPRLRCVFDLRPARRLLTGPAGRAASDLGGDCSDVCAAATGATADGKPRRWRSETKNTVQPGVM